VASSSKKKPVLVVSDQFASFSYTYNTLDTSGRHALDVLIRRNGWLIYSRPRKGQALWVDKEGNVLKQSDVLKGLNANAVEDASYLQELYYRQDM
jgi:hypothetical protein